MEGPRRSTAPGVEENWTVRLGTRSQKGYDMIVEALIIGLCIIVGTGMVGVGLDKINDTLQRILKRYAALENLGIFKDMV